MGQNRVCRLPTAAERYDAVESDDEDEWVRGPGDDDDDKDHSGDGKRDRETREGAYTPIVLTV